MRFPLRFTLSAILFIALLVMGFIYLLRGCLSKYDERSALPRVLYFKKDTQSVVFSIVKFEKATSYSQKGGFISKSVSTNYFIQTNNATTGAKINQEKVKHHRDIKTFPVEIMGASDGIAWIFMGEPMAFDPFTLEKLADMKILEQKNPPLKGKFPSERRYYRFDMTDHHLYITANDGSGWVMDTKTMIATAHESEPGETTLSREVKKLEKLLKENQVLQDSLFEQKMRRPSRLLAAKEIDVSTYRRMMEGFNAERTLLYKMRDSLQDLKSKTEKLERAGSDIQKKIESLNERTSTHFSQLKVNADTMNGQWFGLYNKKEMEDLYDRFQYQSVYNETARRQLYSSAYEWSKFGDAIIRKDNAALQNPASYFLDGGFLLSKETGRPIQISPGVFLVIYKDQVGNEGKMQVACVKKDGSVNWTADSGLKSWQDYIYTGQQLLIIGTDNKELSGDNCNVLLCVDLRTGRSVRYDYFTDK